MSLHHIKGSEAFAYSDRRLGPAYGSIRMFNARKGRFNPLRHAWPLLVLAALVMAGVWRAV